MDVTLREDGIGARRSDLCDSDGLSIANQVGNSFVRREWRKRRISDGELSGIQRVDGDFLLVEAVRKDNG